MALQGVESLFNSQKYKIWQSLRHVNFVWHCSMERGKTLVLLYSIINLNLSCTVFWSCISLVIFAWMKTTRGWTALLSQLLNIYMSLPDFLIFGLLVFLTYLSIKTSRHWDSYPSFATVFPPCITLQQLCAFLLQLSDHKAPLHSCCFHWGTAQKNSTWLHPSNWGPHTSQSLD